MDLRLTLAILVGQIIAFTIKFFGGGATAAPGLVALTIDPNLVRKMSPKLKHGSILISGTNGKTTTARLTSDLVLNKFKLIHNRQGSNLLRGITSTLITNCSLLGNPKADIAIWEVDEATVPIAVEHTAPKIIALTNLFRDQLDRYGEVDTIRAKWQKSLLKLAKTTTVILNADDPGISILSQNFKGKKIFFGINDQKLNLPEITHVADIRSCLICSSKLKYSALLSAHMGHYFCSNCNFKRPKPNVSAQNLNFKPDFSTKTQLTINNEKLTTNFFLPGLYNVYNVLAATAIGNALRIDTRMIIDKIRVYSSAFGRFQKINVGGKKIIIFLIKNPAGANEVIRTIAQKDRISILAILNDNIADGRDVSWIWDTNWELLQNKTKTVYVSGSRAWDLANRLKYAQINLSKNNVCEDISYSLSESLEKLDTKNTLIILPTYTALLEIQRTLAKLGGTTKWHEQ